VSFTDKFVDYTPVESKVTVLHIVGSLMVTIIMKYYLFLFLFRPIVCRFIVYFFFLLCVLYGSCGLIQTLNKINKYKL